MKRIFIFAMMLGVLCSLSTGCGTNGNITYWDASDGQAIRVINGGAVFLQSLDVDPNGEYFVCGGHDKLLTLWHYDDGLPVAVGRG